MRGEIPVNNCSRQTVSANLMKTTKT